MLKTIVTGAAIALASPSLAATITFETIPGDTPAEGLAISTQFLADYGITFSLKGGGSPVLAMVGDPLTAFAGPPNHTTSDLPAAGQGVGRYFLTDDGQLTPGASETLVVTYEQATDAASGVILDIDFTEYFIISLYDAQTGGNLLASHTIDGSDPGTGDGIATFWSFNRASADVYRIEFVGDKPRGGGFGLAFDNFSYNSSTPAVPLPPAAYLMAGGLAGLGLLRRR